MLKPALSLPLLLLMVRWTATAAAEPSSLTFRATGDAVFEVTSNGLSRILFQGRPLATGEWSVFNAESWFSRNASNGPVQAGQFQERTLQVLSPAHAVVLQRKDDLLCVFDYSFAAEDMTISAYVENQNPHVALRSQGFQD